MNTLDLAYKVLTEEPTSNVCALNAAKTGLIDYIASSYMAEDEKEVVLLKTALKEKNRGLVTGERGVRRAEDRALLNGFRAHVLDIDDAHGSVRGHPGSVILSALFSVAEKGDRGKDFLDAYIIGTEVMARLGEAVNPEHYQKGWHNTGTLGGIAAAAALSRYWHLDKETTAMAMGIAATRASGLRAQFGTSVKALHVGFAASAAVQAIELSCSGLSGQKDILFSPYGFLDVMADFDRKSEQERRERLGRSLEAPWGIKWKIADPGLWFKRYPFCSAAMAGCDAAMALRERYCYKDSDIREVRVGFFPGKDAALLVREPHTGEEGRFSIEYIVWLGLMGIPYSRHCFSSEPLSDEIMAGLKRVRRFVIREETDMPYTQVVVVYPDGKEEEKKIWFPKGSPQNPFGPEEIQEKLQDAIGDRARAEDIRNRIADLERTSMKSFLNEIIC